jgi:DNA polymerase-3 subunit gamma/tau
MDNFIVSARKYRPSTFNSVVGQSALTITLKNAIKSNHLAHAYLFCGPRGGEKQPVPGFLPKQLTAITSHLTLKLVTSVSRAFRLTNNVRIIFMN